MPGFVHVDIAADNPERAAGFYNRVFGWAITKLEGPVPYWLATPADGKGPGAGIGKRDQPWQTVIPTIDVKSADEIAELIVREGGTIVLPKTTVPGVGHLVTFKDTEGNILSALEANADNPFAGGPRE
jgi:predicted enzyme related to lactoylglutathione lyase